MPPRTFRLLYTAFVRPHLDYAASVWSPLLVKDMAKIERVQRRVTKLVPFLKNLPYEQRLEALQLTSLRRRRLRGDLIQYFKLDKKNQSHFMASKQCICYILEPKPSRYLSQSQKTIGEKLQWKRKLFPKQNSALLERFSRISDSISLSKSIQKSSRQAHQG